jgi:AcrR family transcriptional regulator
MAETARRPLNRARVLQAAVALADENGLESLSMRKLAGALGVEAMSLYHHVASKGEIVDGIVDVVVREFELPRPGFDWKAALRQAAISAHDALVRHRWACRLIMSADAPSRLAWMEAVLATLRQGGFSAELTHHAYHALDSHIIGFTLWQVSIPFAAEELPQLAESFLRDFPAADFPYLAEHIEQHARPAAHDESEFVFGLDLILDGLERLRDEES